MPWYAWLLVGALFGVVAFWFGLVLYFAKDYLGIWWPRRRQPTDEGTND